MEKQKQNKKKGKTRHNIDQAINERTVRQTSMTSYYAWSCVSKI